MSTSSKGSSAAVSDSAPPISTLLARVRRGEITFDEYLEAQIEEAVAHLKGRVSEERLELARDTLRDSLLSDPSVVDYVQRLRGGQAPDAKG